ncbi:MAG: kinase [Candidatus Binatia bacterium]|nr:kinase [Candidatus Binatia bacterium]
MILTATPYRVSLFGGGTDYPAWYREHGGLVVGMAIDKYCYIGVKRAPPGQGVKYRITYSKIEDRERVEDITHPAVRGVLKFLGVDEPIDVNYVGDLPSGGGLGASSSYVVGLLQALRTLREASHRHDVFPDMLARDAIHVERNVIGEAVGDQDQLFAAHGGLRHFRFHANDRHVSTTPIHLSDELNRDLERSMVLVYTGTMRYAHEMAAKVIDAIPAHGADLSELQALAGEAVKVLEMGGLSDVAYLLNIAWRIKKRLHREITNPIVDALYDHGRICGATAGKLLGAGGGGFMLFLVPPERRVKFEQEIGAPCVRFKVAPTGCRVVINER